MLSGETAEIDSCPYYELDIETLDWMRVQTFGTNPGLRSHHTASIAKTSMIILGGQDLTNGPDHQITNSDLKESIVGGFYDIFMLDIGSRTWSKIERFDEISPKLWGHSAVTFNHEYILIYGGFDVSQTESEGVVQIQPGDPPSCSMSEQVYILDLSTYSWRSSTPNRSVPTPVPRAMHVAVAYGNEMLVFGGMTFDSTGRAININDCWLWNIATGVWAKMEFCVPYWPSKRLLCTVHNGRFYVCNDLLSVHSFDFSYKNLGWSRNKTDPSLMFEGSEPGQIAPWDSDVPQDPTIAPMRHPAPQAAAIRFPEIAPPPPPPPHGEPIGSRVHFNDPITVNDRRESPVRKSRVRIPAPQPPPQHHHPQQPHRHPTPQSMAESEPVINNNKVIRGLQDQENQLQAMLREAERSRQAQNIARLQSEMKSLKDELGQLTTVKERIAINTNQLNSSLESPSRRNHPSFGMPDGTGPSTVQHQQVNALKHYLDSLHTEQQSVILEQKRRHTNYLTDIQQGHDAQMAMIHDRSDVQQKAHQQLAEVQNNLELEQKQKEQIEIIKEQFDKLMSLQGAAETNIGTIPATTGLPTAAEEMAGIVNQMNRIPNITSSPSPAWPSNLTHNMGLPPTQRNTLGTPLPIPVPNHVHTAHQQVPLNSRKAHHIEGLRRQLQSMESNPPPHDKIRSPFRGVSIASSSPGPYWDRLKDILGNDDYVAVGDHFGSPSPRVV